MLYKCRLAGVLRVNFARREQNYATEDSGDAADCVALGTGPSDCCHPAAGRGLSTIYVYSPQRLERVIK